MELDYTASVCHTYLNSLGYFRCSQDMQAMKTEDHPFDGEDREPGRPQGQRSLAGALARWGAAQAGLRRDA